jgi:hypothetical protein
MTISTPTTAGQILTSAYVNNNINSGLVYVKEQTVGSGVASVTVTNAFSAEYDNYRIVVSGVDCVGAGSAMTLQLTSQTTGVYRWSVSIGTHGGNAFSSQGDTGNTSWSVIGLTGTSDDTFITIDISNPFSATRQTSVVSTGSATNSRWYFGGVTTTAASNTGFTLGSASNMTGGTIIVYGYRKA